MIRVGVSSCLLGHAVRWDGGHKRHPYLTSVLGRHVEWVPVCPEAEMGLGVPREPIQLEGNPRAPRLVGRTSRTDLTARMRVFARRRVKTLASLDLCGYVLKSRSPSCGMARVPVSGRGRRGVGAFARVLLERMPLLPVVEETRLDDPRLRKNFLERVHAFHRLRDLLAKGPSARRLVLFHAREEGLLRAHSPSNTRRLEQLAARALAERYAALYMRTLADHA